MLVLGYECISICVMPTWCWFCVHVEVLESIFLICVRFCACDCLSACLVVGVLTFLRRHGVLVVDVYLLENMFVNHMHTHAFVYMRN